jgi:hypothetical protein
LCHMFSSKLLSADAEFPFVLLAYILTSSR